MSGGDLQPRLRLGPDGAERHPAALSTLDREALRALAEQLVIGRSGVRVFGEPALVGVLSPQGGVGRLASAALGAAARPVRAIVFDKTPDANWAVGWHQDRSIAVRARYDASEFGPWSIKAGVIHVEPPFDVMAAMITLRVHLDDCDEDNAPLLIAPGSHRLGRVPAAQAAAMAEKLGPAVCLADAGDVWVYATPILHASDRARRPRRRRVLQVDYAAADLPHGLAWLGVH